MLMLKAVDLSAFRLLLQLLFVTVLLGLGLKLSAAETEKQQKTRVQIEQLATQIQALQKDLEDARDQFGEQQQALKQTDLEIQSNHLDLRRLQQQAKEQQLEITQLEKDQQTILSELGLEKHQLAEQLRQAWLLGRGNQLKLLLNQDNLSQGNRMLTYYRYFNQSRLTQIEKFDQQLAELEQNYRQIQAAIEVLELLQTDAQTSLQLLQQNRDFRQSSIRELDRLIVAKSSRLSELEQDRKDLETLLVKLQDLLGDIPDDLGVERSLQAMKGKLPEPIKGRIRYRYGDPRSGALKWKGWFYETTIGTDVRSIAKGRIAYADWLRGYGLLIIIDHGDGFMSLYSNNESLFKAVGGWVEANETIAQSGPAVNNSFDGLYFELRHAGKALNPSSWLKKR